MKLNKKTIIILIVVAVAGYLLWKNRKNTTVAAATVAGGTVSLDPTNLEDVIAAAQISNSLAAIVRQKYADADAMQSLKDTIQRKANDKGNTYAQQVLFEALYVVYHMKNADGTWVPKSDAEKATWQAIVARVKNM